MNVDQATIAKVVSLVVAELSKQTSGRVEEIRQVALASGKYKAMAENVG